MLVRRPHPGFRPGLSLVEMLAVLVVLAILMAVLLPRYLGKSSVPGEADPDATPMERARSVECMTNLLQLRQAHTMHTTLNDTSPASLDELRAQGVLESMLGCPVGAIPYQYDPMSGQIACAYPGHQQH